MTFIDNYRDRDILLFSSWLYGQVDKGDIYCIYMDVSIFVFVKKGDTRLLSIRKCMRMNL